MKDRVDIDGSVQRADSGSVAHPSLAPCARNPLFISMMPSVTDFRGNPSVHTAKKPDQPPRKGGAHILLNLVLNRPVGLPRLSILILN